MDLILLANALDILLENHFHDSIPHFSPENRCSCCVYSIAHLSLLGKRDRAIIFGGRLGEYKYYDMDKVIEVALDVAAKELA